MADTKSQYPKAVENCPLVDTIIEVRFATGVPGQAVLGMIYSKLQKQFPTLQNLPISQFPPAVVQDNPNLTFQPHYKLIGTGFSAQVGPGVLSVSPIIGEGAPYPGWDFYLPVVKGVFQVLFETGIVKNFIRVSARYVNFFEGTDIFKKVHLDIAFNNASISYKETALRTVIHRDGYENIFQISNAANRTLNSSVVQFGSLIDIDTYKEYTAAGQPNIESLIADVEEAHRIEKQIWWDLLSTELRSELKPTFT